MGNIYNRYKDNKKRRHLRHNVPKSEIILWNELQGKKLNGFKFRRQYGVGPFVIDFYCPRLKLAIEVDGESHFGNRAKYYDKKRQQFIERFGIQFLRLDANETYDNLDGVLEAILDKIDEM